MISRRLLLVGVIVACWTAAVSAFGVAAGPKPAVTTPLSTRLHSFFGGNKNDDDDLSFLETRDMTREEMEALNKQNEDIMNAELAGMTIFSLVISLPLLYLAWVAFFSETAEIAGDLS